MANGRSTNNAGQMATRVLWLTSEVPEMVGPKILVAQALPLVMVAGTWRSRNKAAVKCHPSASFDVSS